eukprot:bmy_15778T0
MHRGVGVELPHSCSVPGPRPVCEFSDGQKHSAAASRGSFSALSPRLLPAARGDWACLQPEPLGAPAFEARLFDEPQLASLCLENIDKNTADAITAEGFTDIDLEM